MSLILSTVLIVLYNLTPCVSMAAAGQTSIVYQTTIPAAINSSITIYDGSQSMSLNVDVSASIIYIVDEAHEIIATASFKHVSDHSPIQVFTISSDDPDVPHLVTINLIDSIS